MVAHHAGCDFQPLASLTEPRNVLRQLYFECSTLRSRSGCHALDRNNVVSAHLVAGEAASNDKPWHSIDMVRTP